jgi:hypothetical protein
MWYGVRETEFCLPIKFAGLCATLSHGNGSDIRIVLNGEVEEWCEENLRGRVHLNAIRQAGEYPFRLFFENAVDLIFFKMRWYD